VLLGSSSTAIGARGAISFRCVTRRAKRRRRFRSLRPRSPLAPTAPIKQQQSRPSATSTSARPVVQAPLTTTAAIARRAARPTPAAPVRASAATAPSAAPKKLPSYLSKPNDQVRVLVAGPTGYIGKFVVKELVSRGYQVFALSRENAGIKGKMGKDDIRRALQGATVVFGDPTDRPSMERLCQGGLPGGASPDVVVSCLASRTGGKKDSWRVDHDASKNVFEAGAAAGAEHLVLLSAICVQKPLLEFQKAKLALEQSMAETAAKNGGSPSFSIVRPTAFFKSLAGQIKLVAEGKPYVMFGDGTLAACKPISERDLASFIADCVRPSAEASEGAPDGTLNAVLPIGGPGRAMTAKDQADALFRLASVKPNYFPVPVALMDGIISILDFFAKFFPQMEDSAEFGRIGKYYATESMLVWDATKNSYDADATPSYGKDTLEGFFQKALTEGLEGQELGDQAVFGVNE
jgi:divinyl chlorophyllide a 8-vinyl-reductase